MINSILSNKPLTPFAQTVAQSILEAFPHWNTHIISSSADEFILEIPLGHHTDQVGLFVQTDSDLEYITVGIGPGHAELADWNGTKGFTELAQDAIGLLQSILQEQYVGAKLTTGGVLLAITEIGRPDIQRIVSWRGTFDRT